MTTPSFNIGQDASATFAAYTWLQDKSDDGPEILEADVGTNVGAVWGNGMDEALVQINEIFQGERFIDALGIGSLVSDGVGDSNDLVIGGSSSVGINLKSSSDSGFCNISMGDPSSTNAGRLQYNHASARWSWTVEGTNELRLDNTDLSPNTDAGLSCGHPNRRWATTHTDDLVVTTSIDIDGNDADIVMGDGAAGSDSRITMQRGAGGTIAINMITGTSSGTGDTRILFDGTNMDLQAHNGTSYQTVQRVKDGAWGVFGTSSVQAAAYTPTNVSTDRSYDANATSTAELADVLGTLIADLQAYGLLQ